MTTPHTLGDAALDEDHSRCHLDEHAAVLKSLDEVHAILVADDKPVQGKVSLAQRLADQLNAWLPEHVREMDSSVATPRLKRRFGGAPMKIMRR